MVEVQAIVEATQGREVGVDPLLGEWGCKKVRPCTKISSRLSRQAIWAEMIWIEATRFYCLQRLWPSLVCLSHAAQGNMPQPLVFRINSMRTKKIVYCGVLEFVSPDDACVLPNWVRRSHPDI